MIAECILFDTAVSMASQGDGCMFRWADMAVHAGGRLSTWVCRFTDVIKLRSEDYEVVT